jgi:hypothetical protein
MWPSTTATLQTDLQLWKPSICVSPFSKAPLKQTVMGVVDGDSQKCSIIFVGIGKGLNAKVCQGLLQQHVVTWV